MKVAISSNGKNLESLIDPRFGRCPYFLFVETDDPGPGMGCRGRMGRGNRAQGFTDRGRGMGGGQRMGRWA